MLTFRFLIPPAAALAGSAALLVCFAAMASCLALRCMPHHCTACTSSYRRWKPWRARPQASSVVCSATSGNPCALFLHHRWKPWRARPTKPCASRVRTWQGFKRSSYAAQHTCTCYTHCACIRWLAEAPWKGFLVITFYSASVQTSSPMPRARSCSRCRFVGWLCCLKSFHITSSHV